MNNDHPDVQMTIVWLVSLKNKHTKMAMWFKLINHSNDF
jgi:hypothetical protein